MKMIKRVFSIMMAIVMLVSIVSISAEALKVSIQDKNFGFMVPVNNKGTKTLSKVNLYGDYDYLNFYIHTASKSDTHFFYEIYSDKNLTNCIDSGYTVCSSGDYNISKKIKLKGKYKSKTYYAVTYAGKFSSDKEKLTVDENSMRQFTLKVDRSADFDDKIVILKETKNTTKGAYIKWSKLSGASKYYIYRRSITGTKWTKVGSVSSSKDSFTDTSVKNKNGNYIYTVKAINKKGTASRYLYFGLTSLFAKTPTMKSIAVTYNNAIEVKWNSTSSKAKYNIMRKEGGGSWKTIKSNYSGTSYKDTSVKSGKKYTYSVKAVISTSYGKATSSYYANDSKAVIYLRMPTLKKAVAVENGINVSWYTVSGATGFTILRKNSDGSTGWSSVGKVGADATSFVDTSANIETGYIYSIRSEASKNKGSYNRTGIEYIYVAPETIDIVAHYAVVNGKVINLVNGKEMENAIVDDDGYFRGGKVELPSSYEKASIEAVMVYNRTSTDLPVGNGLSYYGGTFLFQEAVNPNNLGMIKTPFGGGWIGTNFTLRPSLNYNKRVMNVGESYWCLAFDKNESTHAMQINDDYVEKAHWSNYINRTFNLSAEHQFKEFVVYSGKLTKEEMADHFANSGISLGADTNTIVGRVNNGITGLGSAFAYTKTGQYGIPEWYDTNTKAGNYSVDDGNGMTLTYTISDYIEPDLGIDHSKYESVHIIKKPETLPIGYKYALSAVPYPFNVNHNGASDQYDVSWASSDESVALVIDGLVIPQKTGTVTITATLRGTGISDSCTIEIVNKEATKDIAIKISADYVSENGNSFSESDYVMTTKAIYDAISEAYEDGYNHIVFPEINFYAAPTETEYYIPSGMTVEFPEGSAFYMMPSELAKTKGYTYFRMGWGWWSCAIPTEVASVKKDENGNILAYYCSDAHLIIDKYYGEFYEGDATMSELYEGANQYQWGCTLLSVGKRAEFCSVEIREANCPTGFFITMGGKGNSQLVNGEKGSIAANEFVSGWLNDSGELVENPDWISTSDFYLVSKAVNGMDTMHEYYIGHWEDNVIVATQHLYDILWYDKDYNLIGANRWQYIDEGYSNKPQNAVYFKLSIQQSELPAGTDEYVRICPDESSKFCEIKNTNIINGADGLASVVGATEACWIHDNYVSGDGLLRDSCWSLNLENGWVGMRGTIIERNIFRKYTYATIGEYRGPDTGVLSLASGYNTFVISNYLGAIEQHNYNVANTHIINNVVHSMYSSFSNGKPNDIRPKIYAHTYYNVLGQISNPISSNGINYYHQNTIIPTINLW